MKEKVTAPHHVPVTASHAKPPYLHLVANSTQWMCGSRIRDAVSGPGLQQNPSIPTGQNLGLVKILHQPTKLTDSGRILFLAAKF